MLSVLIQNLAGYSFLSSREPVNPNLWYKSSKFRKHVQKDHDALTNSKRHLGNIMHHNKCNLNSKHFTHPTNLLPFIYNTPITLFNTPHTASFLPYPKICGLELQSGSTEVQTRLQVRGRIIKAQSSRNVLCSGEAISNNQNNTEAV